MREKIFERFRLFCAHFYTGRSTGKVKADKRKIPHRKRCGIFCPLTGIILVFGKELDGLYVVLAPPYGDHIHNNDVDSVSVGSRPLTGIILALRRKNGIIGGVLAPLRG